MPNTIELKFDNPNQLTLSGSKNGYKVYQEQLKKHLTPDALKEGITIKFPDSIIMIGSFFIDGLIAPLIELIGSDGVHSKVNFKTSSEELTKEVYSDIL
ncbi:hypothetical protein G6R29_05070 [Fructobacillus sp. M2-14]|uniref:DUF4325 domain-containing protein n=1 Tax=Fructobacillus broussonetiae TaxID=2713173 RepID=A0ABS5R212_9LACO|nr:hypothetical protein [Fructobacillus broussonetiae]MBS9338990.1 hypothetical protein [Fructobacillus broussonetiae]